MNEYLNQILYKNKQFDSYDTIKLLEPYMLGNDKNININTNSTNYNSNSHNNCNNSVNVSIKPELTPIEPVEPVVKLIIEPMIAPPIPITTTIPHKNKNIISPKSMDTLFWCMYIAKYGYGDYLAIGTKYKNKEIEVKQEMIQAITKNPKILKSTSRKITNVLIQEIMAELMIDKKTTMNSFFAMCILNQLHVYIVDTNTKTYLEFGVALTDNENSVNNNNNNNNAYIFYRSVEGFYSIDLECATEQKQKEVLEPLLQLEHGERPIQSISNYKVCDLEIMAKQLGIWSDTKKYKKQDLYNEILVKCIW